MAIDEALPQAAPRLLVVLSAAALLIGLHEAWAGWIEDTTAAQLRARTERSALRRLMQAALRNRSQGSPTRGAGWMSETVGGASDIVATYVGSLSALLTHGCFACTYFGLLIFSSPSAAALVGLASVSIAVASWSLLAWESRALRRGLNASSAQLELLHGLLSSLSAVRGLYCTHRLGAKWLNALTQATGLGIVHGRVLAARELVVSTGGRILRLAVLFWIVARCLDNQSAVGDLLLLTAVAGGFSSSILGLSGALYRLRTLRPQFERVDEVFTRPKASESGCALAPHPGAAPCVAITATDVSHRYTDDGRWILEHRSFSLARNQILHLQAPSGSGKSTLLRLIAGLMKPTSGRLLVFGMEAHKAHQAVLYVPQDCSLFEASILENLRLLSGAEDDTIQRVSHQTGLNDLLATLPMGPDTLVAAEGHNLSSGQRQLIVLTSALASNRPVLLLDEATSQLDRVSRDRIEWQPLLHGRTAIVVDHHVTGATT